MKLGYQNTDYPMTEMPVVELTAIVFGTGGNQIRTVITGGKTHDTFVFPSKRYRRAQCGDGALELMIHQKHEVVSETLDFLSQPCRIEGTVDGRDARAFPDYAYVQIGRRPVLGEAKSSWEAFERPKALVQKALTTKAAEALGWEYEQTTPANFGTQDFSANVKVVQAHRFANVTLRQEQATRRALDRHDGLTLDDLAAAIDETLGRGTALACAMMVRRIVDIDLTKPISGCSRVRPAPERPLAFPRIRL